MIATSVDIVSTSGVELASVSYPHGVRRKFSFSNEPLEVYDGSQILYLKLHISPETPSGQIELPVDISFQACNDILCFAPATQRVAIVINVVSPATPILKTNETLFHGMFNH